jgi:AAA domain
LIGDDDLIAEGRAAFERHRTTVSETGIEWPDDDPGPTEPPPDEPLNNGHTIRRSRAEGQAAVIENPESSWKPVDLTDILNGTWEPPKPTVGRRNDGVGLFYPGKLHTVSSETEAGKTWLALVATFHELMAGNHVCYIDFEDDEGGVVGRLLTLQTPPDTIKDQFHYIRPTRELRNDDLEHLRTIMANRPTLAVVDGVTEAMAVHGLDPLNNKDIAQFGNILPRKLTRAGCATTCMDHVVKANDARGRYALGGVHKLNGLDGAAYVLDNRNPFGIGIRGVSTIRIAKDRPGQLRRNAVPNKSGMFWFADLIIDTTVEGLADGVSTVAAPVERDPEFQPTTIMRRVADALTGKPEGLAQRVLCDVVTGKAETIRVALHHLIADGYVTPKTPHKLIKPYDSDDKESQ